MKTTDNIDPWMQRFSQKLDDYEEPLPPQSWEKLESRLPHTVLRARKTSPLRRWIGIAAALLVAVGSLYFLTQKQKAVNSMSSTNASIAKLADQSSLSLPSNAASLFCDGPACYYLDKNMVNGARIYAVSDDGIAVITAGREGFQLASQNGMDAALQASVLQTLTDHKQAFMQSLSAIFRHSNPVN